MEGLVALLIDTLARKASSEETCMIFEGHNQGMQHM